MKEVFKNNKNIIIIVVIVLIVIGLVISFNSEKVKLNNKTKNTEYKNEGPFLGDSNYIYNSSDVYYDNTTSGLTSDRVKGAIDELYQKCSTPLSTCRSSLSTCQEDLEEAQASATPTCNNPHFQLGDYVSMTPNYVANDSYDVPTDVRGGASAAILKPSYLNLWRVIKTNTDCTVEMVSEYVSNVNVQFKGKVGYQN